MAPAAFDECSFKLQGSTLTSVRDAKGPSTNPTTITLTRVE
jgi:hypothetical protein